MRLDNGTRQRVIGLRLLTWLALLGQFMVLSAALRPGCALRSNHAALEQSVVEEPAAAAAPALAVASCGVVLAEPSAATVSTQLSDSATRDIEWVAQLPLDASIHPLLRPPRA